MPDCASLAGYTSSADINLHIEPAVCSCQLKGLPDKHFGAFQCEILINQTVVYGEILPSPGIKRVRATAVFRLPVA
jgi:hypothetical protein